MTPQEILSASYLDILFEGRNKAYGAFALRRGEPRRQLYALLFLLLPCTALVLLQRHLQATTSPTPAGIVCQYDVPDNDIIFEEIKPEPGGARRQPEQEQAAAPAAETVPRIVSDTSVDSTEASDSPASAAPGPSTSGVAGGEAGAGAGQSGGGNGADTTMAEPNEPRSTVDVQPQFRGNMADWLQRNLRYPEDAVRDGVEGRVVIRFIVEKDGTVRNAGVVRSSGSPVLDEEGLKLVTRMPAWQPGVVAGAAVRSYFSLPITFHLQ